MLGICVTPRNETAENAMESVIIHIAISKAPNSTAFNRNNMP